MITTLQNFAPVQQLLSPDCELCILCSERATLAVIVHPKRMYLPLCRVDAVQQALSTLTSIPEKEQILLLHGNPLDPNKTLGAYKLPAVSIMLH